MPRSRVQSVDRGTGIAAALVDALTRGEFDALPIQVAAGVEDVYDKLLARFFGEKTRGVVLCVAPRTTEIEMEGAGEAIYVAAFGVVASAPAPTNQADAATRLARHLQEAVRADRNLAGTCIHAWLTTADAELRAGSSRVVVEAEIRVRYAAARA